MKEIKEAFISCSKECHPDVNDSSEAASQFCKVREAYRILSNSNSKISYDLKIGNVMKNKSDCDYLDVKSVRMNWQPLDSVAERTVKQRLVYINKTIQR